MSASGRPAGDRPGATRGGAFRAAGGLGEAFGDGTSAGWACFQCGAALPADRPRRRYCSGRCRRKADAAAERVGSLEVRASQAHPGREGTGPVQMELPLEPGDDNVREYGFAPARATASCVGSYWVAVPIPEGEPEPREPPPELDLDKAAKV